MAQRGGLLARTTTCLAVAVALSACGAQIRNHGYVPDPDQLGVVSIGVDTRETVAEAIGLPTTTSLGGEDAWYYVRSRMRQAGPLPPREIERELVAISFSEGGTVANIERFGLEDGRVITLSRRVTESTIRDFGLIQQLLRNFGRIDIGEGLANDT